MKWLFTSLDPEKKGVLTYDEFTHGVREVMGLWITPEDCHDVCLHIDEDRIGEINFKNFNTIPFKEIISRVGD